ncbi:hypothetical protein [Aestuariispira insulae]|uniref:Uncharacterized protein n=1 Tax=Aestuariispira insulae TaxID=1461337 RepID=A0A3D9HGD4_9PROT|nr:hypothetical protein [Aestuariispira insulae]RED48056.1 hypothetical protein DFP90_10874 [Aestuariispira insulae]
MGSISNLGEPVPKSRDPAPHIRQNQPNNDSTGLNRQDTDLLSQPITAQLFADRIPVARDPGRQDDVFLSRAAGDVLDQARDAIQRARGFVRETVAGAIRDAAGDFLQQLGAIAGQPVGKEASLAGFSEEIGRTASEKAEQLGQSLLEETGNKDFSFKEIKLSVVVETFDLRVATNEHSAAVQLKRVSLRVEIEEVEGSLTKKDSVDITFPNATKGPGLPEPDQSRTPSPLDPEAFDPLAETLDQTRGDLRSVLDRLKEERSGLNQDYLATATRSLGDLFDKLFGGPVSRADPAEGRLTVRPELVLIVEGGDGRPNDGLRRLPDLRPGGIAQLDA